MELIKFFSPIFAFIASLFVLYRLLVKKYEEHIKLLTDELSIKRNYKNRLDEIKLFYEEETNILNKKLDAESNEKGIIQDKLQKLKDKISEVESFLSRNVTESGRLENLLQNAHSDYMDRIKTLQNEKQEIQDRYLRLCQKIIDEYGVNTAIRFTEPDEYSQFKLISKKNRSLRYKIQNPF